MKPGHCLSGQDSDKLPGMGTIRTVLGGLTAILFAAAVALTAGSLLWVATLVVGALWLSSLWVQHLMAYLGIKELFGLLPIQRGAASPVPIEPPKPTPVPSHVQPARASIRDHFDAAFSTTPALATNRRLTFPDKVVEEIVFREHQDASARSMFISVFVPKSSRPFELLGYIAENYRAWMDEARAQFKIDMRAPGDHDAVVLTSLPFSGALYLYFEDDLTLQQLASLESAFEAHGAKAIFRGQPYALATPPPPPVELGGLTFSIEEHNVTSIGQTGGITAHTVNQAPAPEFVVRKQAGTRMSDGKYTITIDAEVVCPYPVSGFYLEAHSDGIESLEMIPENPGVVHGSEGAGEGFLWRKTQQAHGKYKVVVRSVSPAVRLEHRFD